LAQIKLTSQEAKYVILKAFGFQAEYKPEYDICVTPHSLEIVDVKPKLEESTRQS
jgi:hypothetical protein